MISIGGSFHTFTVDRRYHSKAQAIIGSSQKPDWAWVTKQYELVRLLSILVFLSLFTTGNLWAATTSAPSCSQSNVNAAVANASDGDTVLIPAGNCTWSSPLTITNKSISIIGSGESSTFLTNASGRELILWELKPVGISRLSGFTTTDNGSGCGGGDGGSVHIRGDSPSFRLDHVTFTAKSCVPLRIHENVRGVIDHNTCTNSGFCFIPHHGKWQNINSTPGYPDGQGDQSWAAPSTMGTANQLVFEDNVFNRGSGAQVWTTDDHHGTRSTYRFNRFNNVVMANHGTETGGRSRSVRHWEVYQNTFTWTDPSTSALSHLRGGTGMIFDNKGTGDVQKFFDMSHYRNLSDNRQIYAWGGCGIQAVTSLTRSGSTATATVNNHSVSGSGSYITISGANESAYNGTFVAYASSNSTFTFTISGSPPSPATGSVTARSPFDQNSSSIGYRCLDQPGAGQGSLISGEGPGDGAMSPLSWPNQALEPIYISNNTVNGVLSAGVSNFTDTVQANRDFYNQNTSFNGTTGIGRGPRSSRPSTCTAGVAYWSTDQGGNWNTTDGATNDGTLDKCTTTNTWTNAFYTPLTYPHPLTGGTPTPTDLPPSPPTGVAVR